jgi:hypothetical protein
MYYWFKKSDRLGASTLTQPTMLDMCDVVERIAIYSMDKTIGAIQNKILRHAKAWPDKYKADDVYIVKTKQGHGFKLHGRYKMLDGKLRRIK